MENIAPSVLSSIRKEVKNLKSEPIDGVEVAVNDVDFREIDCTLTGPRDTPYYGGKFRLKICFSNDFPVSPPKAYFITKIFHPNIAPISGEVCVNTLKRDWQPSFGIKHVLLTISCLLVEPNSDSALNEDAAKLLMENYNDYARRAKMFTEIHATKSQIDNCAGNDNMCSNIHDSETTEPLAHKKSKPKDYQSKKMLRRL